MLASDNESLGKSIEAFRLRAKRLRWSAIFMILLIVLVLCAGIAIFVFAGQLANSEAFQTILKEKRERIQDAKKSLDDANAEVSFRQIELARYQEQLFKEIGGAPGTGNSGKFGYGPLAKTMEEQILYAKNQVNKEEARVASLQDQVVGLERELKQTEAAGVESVSKQDQLSRVISAIATRIGSVVILLFLVKILVPLYRYNMRLASYFDARADALELLTSNAQGERDVAAFELLVSTLTPTAIDFGPSPRSPSEEALEWTKQVLNSRLK